MDIGNSFVQKLGKVGVFIRDNGIFFAESAGHGFPFAKYHFRMIDKVGVHLHAVFIGVQVYPFRLNVDKPVPLL